MSDQEKILAIFKSQKKTSTNLSLIKAITGLPVIKFIFLSIFILCAFTSYCQTDTAKIYNTNQLKRGFYKNYKEFLKNSPSLVIDFSNVPVLISKKDTLKTFMGFKFTGNLKITGYTWGFCDGEYVYVNPNHSAYTKIYCRLESLGPHPFFNTAYNLNNSFITLISMFIPSPNFLHYELKNLGANLPLDALPPVLQQLRYNVMIINEKGKPGYPDHDYMKKILSPYPDLQKSFEEDWKNFARFDYPTDEVETDESKEAKIATIKNYLVKLNERTK